ncbi:MAG: hypothetical protein PHH08_03910, partial [Candidatus ainarchaeum sp.]|nr:hypothetical protein [Candidatus ainarchaeum sp.]
FRSAKPTRPATVNCGPGISEAALNCSNPVNGSGTCQAVCGPYSSSGTYGIGLPPIVLDEGEAGPNWLYPSIGLAIDCSPGAFITVEGTAIPASCSDSDGANEFAQGFVTSQTLTWPLWDYCTSDSTGIEYLCTSDGFISSMPFSCPGGYFCSSGACATDCFDSDGGKDIHVKGYITDRFVTNPFWDYCESNGSSKIFENYCNDHYARSEWIDCPQGEACYDGACKPVKTCEADYSGQCGEFDNGQGGKILCGCASNQGCDVTAKKCLDVTCSVEPQSTVTPADTTVIVKVNYSGVTQQPTFSVVRGYPNPADGFGRWLPPKIKCGDTVTADLSCTYDAGTKSGTCTGTCTGLAVKQHSIPVFLLASDALKPGDSVRAVCPPATINVGTPSPPACAIAPIAMAGEGSAVSVIADYSNFSSDPAATLICDKAGTFSCPGTPVKKACGTGHTQNSDGTCTASFWSAGGGGWLEYANASWETAHDSAVSTGGAVSAFTTAGSKADSSGLATIKRGFIPFNTSSIPDDAAIVSAELAMQPQSIINTTGNPDAYYGIVQTSQDSPDSLFLADYSRCGTYLSRPKLGGTIKASELIEGAFSEIVFNETGRQWIDPVLWSHIGIRDSYDIDDLPVPDATENKATFNTGWGANAAQLIVVYDPGFESCSNSCDPAAKKCTGTCQYNSIGTFTPRFTLKTGTEEASCNGNVVIGVANAKFIITDIGYSSQWNADSDNTFTVNVENIGTTPENASTNVNCANISKPENSVTQDGIPLNSLGPGLGGNSAITINAGTMLPDIVYACTASVASVGIFNAANVQDSKTVYVSVFKKRTMAVPEIPAGLAVAVAGLVLAIIWASKQGNSFLKK